MRFWLLLVPALLCAQPDPGELLRQSADAIKQYKSYQIKSTVSVVMRGGTIQSNLDMPSTVSVRRPDRMRVESKSQAGGVSIVSDGEHTWILLTPLNEFIKREAAAAPEEAAGKSGLLSKNLPDVSQFVKSVQLHGQEILKVGADRIPCWIVQTIYDTIDLPEQGLAIHDAAQLTWISKGHHLNLQTTFHAKLKLESVAEPVEMTQSTRTTSLRFNVDLPDTLFAFTPPEDAKETADWTLPGIDKPDVIGKRAPDLKAKSVHGDDVDLHGLRGKVVMLDFWTTWCIPCKRELPVLEKLHTEFHDSGLELVGINVDDEQGAVRDFVKSVGLPYPVVPLDSAHDLVTTLAVNAFPTVVLIDREGKIVSYEVGARGEAALRADLAKLGIGVAGSK
jgi:thiol-disulfide isomerase/thioredoxin